MLHTPDVSTENYFINIFSIIYSFVAGELCAKILSTQDEYAFITLSLGAAFFPFFSLNGFTVRRSFFLFSFFFQQAFKHSRVIDWFMNTSRATPLRWGKKKKSVDKLHPRSDVGFRGWNRMAGTKGQCMIPLTSRGCLENLSYLWFSKNQIEPFFFRTRVFHPCHERKKKKEFEEILPTLRRTTLKKRKGEKRHALMEWNNIL